ncbi:MAG: S-layer homology domain-containing protein, partial [Clostridiales bacterium]|nr:S-layer homology domain-containing protein [Clostridiales bacterium]
AYTDVTAATQKDVKNKLTLVINTIQSEFQIYINGTLCYTSPALSAGIDKITELRWYIPVSAAAPTHLRVENLSVGVRQRYREMIAADAERLSLERTENVKENFPLPLQGANGSSIRWSSDNTALIAISGGQAVVNRPAAQVDSASATLPAAISAGEWTQTKTFVCTLYGLTPEDIGIRDGKAYFVSLPSVWEYDGAALAWSASEVEIVTLAEGLCLNGYYMSETSKPVTLTMRVKNADGTSAGTKQISFILENPSAYDLTAANIQYPNAVVGSSASSSVAAPDGTLWVSDENDASPYYRIDFGVSITANTVELTERFSRVKRYEIACSANGANWTTVHTGMALGDGNTALITFPPMSFRYLRYKIVDKTPGATGLADVGVFYRYDAALRVNDNLNDLRVPSDTTQNLALPRLGAAGLAVAWSSSEISVVTNDGIVTRPAKNTTVVLTASTTHDGMTASRKFTVAVNAREGGGAGGSAGSSRGSGGIVPPTVAPPSEPSDSPPAPPTPLVVFADVAREHWAWEYIASLKNKGILHGVTQERFEPESNVTRAEFVKLALAVLSTDVPNTVGTPPFSDVSADAWYAPYVNAAFEQGIVKGVSDTEFGASLYIKRQDIAVILARGLAKNGVTLPRTASRIDFADTEGLAQEAKESISALQRAGVLSGGDGVYFKPEEFATRAETAKIIHYIYGFTR